MSYSPGYYMLSNVLISTGLISAFSITVTDRWTVIFLPDTLITDNNLSSNSNILRNSITGRDHTASNTYTTSLDGQDTDYDYDYILVYCIYNNYVCLYVYMCYTYSMYYYTQSPFSEIKTQYFR